MRLVVALTFLVCLFAPEVAFAMPAALPALAIAAGLATPATIGAWVVASQVASVVLAVGTMAYSAKQKRKANAAGRAKYNAGLQDRLATTASTEAPHVYIIGEKRVGANVVFMGTSGAKDQFQHIVAVVATHECESLGEIYLNGKPLGALDAYGFSEDPAWSDVGQFTFYETKTGPVFTLDNDAAYGHITLADMSTMTYTVGVVGPDKRTVTLPPEFTGTYSFSYTGVVKTKWVRVKKHLGYPGEPADANLIDELPGKWTPDHVLPGWTYIYLRVDVNKHELQDGPPAIQVDVQGMKLYDVRTGVTSYHNNPVNVAYWYLTSELCNISPAMLPLSKFQTAANVCAEPVANLGGQPRYTFNGVITSDEPQSEVLKKLVVAMAGGIDATTWDIFAGKYVAPIRDFYQEDIVGGVSIVANTNNADLFNGVRGQFVGPETGHVVTDFPPHQNAAFRATDGIDLYTDLDFPYTNWSQRIHNITRILIERNRNGMMVTADFSAKAWDLSIGDRITLTSEFWGWAAKVFIVENIRRKQGAPVELVLQEDAPEIWDEADAISVDALPNTNLQDPYAIAPLASITLTSNDTTLSRHGDGTIDAGILAAWPLPTTASVVNNGYVEIEVARLDGNEPVWRKLEAPGNQTSAMISPVEEGYQYVVRARTCNPTLNVKSGWLHETILAAGKAAPPNDLVDFEMGQLLDGTRSFGFNTNNQPVDLDGFRIKYRVAGSAVPWASMTPLHNGLISVSRYETSQPAAGDYDFAIVAVDTSGNESANPKFFLNAHLTEYVGFVQGGEGAVEQSIQEKLRQIAVSVADYGATGGNLPGDELINTIAFQRALTYLNSLDPSGGVGGVLEIPSGNFRLLGLTTYRAIKWRGRGSRTTELKFMNASGTAVVLEDANEFEGIQFMAGELDGTNPEDATFSLPLGKRAVFRDCWIQDYYKFINSRGTLIFDEVEAFNGAFNSAKIDSNAVVAHVIAGRFLAHNYRSNVSAAYGGDLPHSSIVIHGDGNVDEVKFSGRSAVANHTNGVRIAVDAGDTLFDFEAVGLQVTGNIGDGINVVNGGTIRRIALTGGQLDSGTGDGLDVTNTGTIQTLQVVGTRVSGNTGYGIKTAGTINDLTLLPAYNNNLAGDLLDSSTNLRRFVGSEKANANSPYLSGNPTADTQASGTNNGRLATTGFAHRLQHGFTGKFVGGASNVTLTAAEAAYPTLNLTGALTGNIAVIVPAAAGSWQFKNSTTGAFALTVKTASGTGITIAQGEVSGLYCDGTNVLRSTVDSLHVQTALAALVDSSPAALDTLNELAAALGDDPNFATTVTNSLAGKEPTIAAGTVAQYWRGDKGWRDLFTDVRLATLTGLSTATNSAIAAADTLLVAMGKLQAQITARVSKTGNETIAGQKTFSDKITVANTAPEIVLSDTDNASETLPARLVNTGGATYLQTNNEGKLYLSGHSTTDLTSLFVRWAGAWQAIYHAGNKPTAADVGLGSVSNTSDADKPVSALQQAALDLKANLASPTLTGTPIAPTAGSGTNTGQLATTAFAHRLQHGYLSKAVAGTGDITLSTLEASYPTLNLTGVLTGARNVIVPTAAGNWRVRNSTTGAFALTVKTAAGTGIVVAQGAVAQLTCDGTNVVSAITDVPGNAATVTNGVYTTGNQTVGGTKTFSSAIVVNNTFSINGSGPAEQITGLYVADLGSTQGTTLNPTFCAAILGQVSTSRSVGFAYDGSHIYGFRSHSSAGTYTWASRVKQADALTTARAINGAPFDGSASISFDTDAVDEGAFNLYHTAQRARDSILTGLSTAAGTVVTASHTILEAIGFLQKQTSDNTTAIGTKANLASPTLTGTPIAPTAGSGTNTGQLATTAFAHRLHNGFTGKFVGGAVDVTLSASEAAYPIINLTGALTANINVIVPTASGQWIIKNSTTGAFTLTVKTSGGSGVIVAASTAKLLYCDGTNVYAV